MTSKAPVTGQTILALDTSSKAASCALTQNGVLLGEFFLHTALTHSETMLPMLQSLLDTVGLTLAAVDVFAISTGPGSFTGLRIGISAVKAMAMACGKPCAAVSTLEALAAGLCSFTGLLVPALDARRSQVYAAIFSCENGLLTRLTPDAALPVDALLPLLREYGGRPILLAGDGTALCKEALAQLPQVALAPEAVRYQRASAIAAVAATLPPEALCTAGELAPAYLRLPQAERERMQRLQNRPVSK